MSLIFLVLSLCYGKRNANMLSYRIILFRFLSQSYNVREIRLEVLFDLGGHSGREHGNHYIKFILAIFHVNTPLNRIPVIRTEILSPLRNTVRLVEDYIFETPIHLKSLIKNIHERTHTESFRSDIQQSYLT